MPAINSRRAEFPPSSHFQMGCQQRIYSQSARPFCGGFKPRVYKYTRLMRIRYDFLFDSIAVLGIGALDVIAESVFLNVRNRALQIALLFVKEGISIRDKELHIANLWAVDGR